MRDNFRPEFIHIEEDDEFYEDGPTSFAAAVVSVLILLVGLGFLIRWIFA